jgi:hypothetical protein
VVTYSSPSVTDTGLAYVVDHSGAVHVFRVGDGSEAATYRAATAQIWSATVLDARYRLDFGAQTGAQNSRIRKPPRATRRGAGRYVQPD